MAKFNTTNRKRQSLYEQQIQDRINLERKNNKRKERFVNKTVFKKPKVLYDSGWIQVTNDGGGGNIIINPGIDQDQFAFGSLGFFDDPTTQKGQIVPLSLSYYFMRDIEIPERMIPFVKPTLMFKKHPTIVATGVVKYQPYDYANDYYEIKGDGTLIYQGFDPFGEVFSQFEIDNGHLLSSLTSKWYRGDLDFTDGGNSWEYRQTRMVTVTTHYDVSLSGHPDGDKYNYKRFICGAIDNLTGSSITGTGTFVEHAWTYDAGEDEWTEEVTTELNKTMTAPLLQDICSFFVRLGTKFKNGSFDGPIGSFGVSVLTDGTLQSADNIESFYKVGTVSLGSVSLDFAHETTTIDSTEYGLFRLWYSNKRAHFFNLNGIPELTNLPHVDNYETGTLPYSNITVKVNPEGYPETELEDEDYSRPSHTEWWGKVTQEDSNRPLYRYYAQGTIQLLAPATQDVGSNENFVDENYSAGATSYSLDEENRDDQELPIYVPGQEVVEFRLKLTLQNPFYYETKEGHDKNEL